MLGILDGLRSVNHPWNLVATVQFYQARTAEKLEAIVTGINEKDRDIDVALERLAHAKIDGPGVTLAFMADDKNHVRPIFW
jgi:hypothetical protein